MGRADVRRRLLRMMAQYGIAEFHYADERQTVSLELQDALHPEVRATQAGRFFATRPGAPDAADFPRHVRQGDILGFLKIGPLLLPVIATADGFCPPPLVEDGAIVGFHQALF